MVSVPSLTSLMPDSVVVEVSSLAQPATERARAATLIRRRRWLEVFMAITLDPRCVPRLTRAYRGSEHNAGMPTYVAFLRAINLGAKRKFPKDAIRGRVEAAGGRDVETYINTGNVRLTHSARSVARRCEAALEEAFAADRGFEVPTIVLTPRELVGVAKRADALWAELGEPATHYVTLLKKAPPAAAVAALREVSVEGEHLVVDGRTAHLVLQHGYHESKLAGSAAMDRLGVGTARNVNVVRTLVQKWCQ